MIRSKEVQSPDSQQIPVEKIAKATYETPQLIIHGKVEKMTLQTGGGIPGGGGTGPGGTTVF